MVNVNTAIPNAVNPPPAAAVNVKAPAVAPAPTVIMPAVKTIRPTIMAAFNGLDINQISKLYMPNHFALHLYLHLKA